MSEESVLTGGCQCEAVRYSIEGDPIWSAICHCADCRKSAGAPMVGWAMFLADNFKIVKGKPKRYDSSEHGRRHFCETCGTGLYYVNAQNLPGGIDVQTATLDNPEALPPMVHVQTAERLAYMSTMNDLPMFERYPPMP